MFRHCFLAEGVYVWRENRVNLFHDFQHLGCERYRGQAWMRQPGEIHWLTSQVTRKFTEASSCTLWWLGKLQLKYYRMLDTWLPEWWLLSGLEVGIVTAMVIEWPVLSRTKTCVFTKQRIKGTGGGGREEKREKKQGEDKNKKVNGLVLVVYCI